MVNEGLNKRRIYLSILIAIIIFLSFFIFSSLYRGIIGYVITSRVSQIVTALSSATVLPEYVYDISVGCLQDIVQAGQSISANITITNNGVYEGDVNIIWWIEDAYGTNYTSGSTIVNISYGKTWSSTKSLLVPSSALAGIYYFKVNLNVDDYSSTVHDTFEVQVPVTTTIPTAGGGITQPVTETKTVSSIPTGGTGNFYYEKSAELTIQEIIVEVKNTVNNVGIKIEESIKPVDAPEVVSLDEGKVYKYIKITPTNIQDSDINKIRIKFEVEKSWVSNNGIDSSAIGLKRYSDNEWNILPTTKLSEDENYYYYYESESTGFSIFAIYGLKTEKIANLEVLYDKELVLSPGIPKVYEIEIKNYGMISLHDLNIYLQGIELSWFSIEPNSVSLAINESVEFKINYSLPGSAEIKKYPISILVKSDETEKTIYLALNVIKILDKTELEDKLKSLEKEITDLEKEIDELRDKRFPVESFYKLLYDAKSRIELARKEIEIGNLKEASELIKYAEIIIDSLKDTIPGITPIQTRIIWSGLLATIIIVAVFLLSIRFLEKQIKRLSKHISRIKL